MTIEEIKEKVVPIAKEYGVSKVALFGSMARGDSIINSDIDLLVDKGASLKMKGWNFFGFCMALEEATNKKVDVVTYRDLERSFLKKYALAEEVIIYEHE